MATDYVMNGARIALDGVSSLTWQAICSTNVTGWDIDDQAIIASTHYTQSHTPVGESFKLRWRNATDGGSFADLTDSGELQRGISAGCISNGDRVADGSGCGIYQDDPNVDEEVENESPLQTATLTATAKQNEVEIQWCVDFSNALYSKEYEFELYSVTGAETLGTLDTTITTGAAPAAEVNVAEGKLINLKLNPYINERMN